MSSLLRCQCALVCRVLSLTHSCPCRLCIPRVCDDCQRGDASPLQPLFTQTLFKLVLCAGLRTTRFAAVLRRLLTTLRRRLVALRWLVSLRAVTARTVPTRRCLMRGMVFRTHFTQVTCPWHIRDRFDQAATCTMNAFVVIMRCREAQVMHGRVIVWL